MKSMVFAAGLGTRLKPLTDTLPKALVPVDGEPLIAHVLRKMLDAGVDESVINVHHFAGKIESWLAGQDWICTRPEDKTGGKMLVQVSDERQLLLETGGAVLHARKYLEGCGHFLIHNVDILSDCDFGWLFSQVRPDAMATLLVSDRKTSRYFLFHPQTMRLVGWINVSSGEYILEEKALNVDECIRLAFSGIHVMSDKVFGAMTEYVSEKGLEVDPGAGIRFPIKDFYLWACKKYPIYGTVADGLSLLDVGKLDALAPAEDFARLHKSFSSPL